MKRYLLLITIISFTYLNGYSQEKMPDDFAFGYHLSNINDNFGLGLDITSPYFAADHIALRLRANYSWLEHIGTNLSETWTGYTNVSLGIVSVGGTINDNIRLYGEGGIIGILPNSEFSSEDFELGGYGLFGFEFFMQKHFSYYIELGGVGSGARADKIFTDPFYSNGFVTQVGFRYQL